MKITDGFLIWATFDYPTQDRLEIIRQKVNGLLKGPDFDIHLTLSGLIELDAKLNESDVFDKFDLLKDQINTIQINLIDYSFRDRFDQSLFIKVKKNTELISLRNKVQVSFGLNPNSFFPHISLFYGEEKEEKKKEVIKELPSFENITSLNKICLAHVEERIDKWEVVKEIIL